MLTLDLNEGMAYLIRYQVRADEHNYSIETWQLTSDK